jgi:hypothetical protein
MRKNNVGGKPATSASRLRCAIYTLKSTEEGLDQEFNSLAAQREASEAFILSQRREGWLALPDRYDGPRVTTLNSRPDICTQSYPQLRHQGRCKTGQGPYMSPGGGALVVNEGEAEQVRSIFQLFEQHRSAIRTLAEIERRGWRLKSWTLQTGDFRQGSPFDRNSLRRLLTNVLYIGSIQHKGQIYPGEHPAIVERGSWERVQEMLMQRATFARGKARNKHHALLSGLLHCDSCGTRMAYCYAVAHGRKYPYYLCLNARRKGWVVCPAKSLPAQRIEDSILEQLRTTQPAMAIPSEWEQLDRGGQIEIIRARVERIGYDGKTRQVSIRFHPGPFEAPMTPVLIPSTAAETAL